MRPLLAAFALLAACTAPTEPPMIEIVHVLPKGFEGRALVIYDRPDGVALEADERHVELAVPESGVLISSYSGELMFVPPNTSVFLLDEAGNRRPIRWLPALADVVYAAESAHADPGEIVAYNLSFGTALRKAGDGYNVYFQYFVGPLGEWSDVVSRHGDFSGEPGPGDY